MMLGVLAALTLNINIQGLTVNEIFDKVTQAINDMDNDKANESIAQFFTDKSKRKEVADKIKKRLIKLAKELRPQSKLKLEGQKLMLLPTQKLVISYSDSKMNVSIRA